MVQALQGPDVRDADNGTLWRICARFNAASQPCQCDSVTHNFLSLPRLAGVLMKPRELVMSKHPLAVTSDSHQPTSDDNAAERESQIDQIIDRLERLEESAKLRDHEDCTAGSSEAHRDSQI